MGSTPTPAPWDKDAASSDSLAQQNAVTNLRSGQPTPAPWDTSSGPVAPSGPVPSHVSGLIDDITGGAQSILSPIGKVLGAPKAAVDWLARKGASTLYGMDVPDDTTTGTMVRAGFGWDPGSNPSVAGRAVGKGIEFGTDIATDPLTWALGGASKVAEGGVAASAALKAGEASFELPGLFGATTRAISEAPAAIEAGRKAAMVGRGAAAAFVPGMASGAISQGSAALKGYQANGLTPDVAEEALGAGLSAGFGTLTALHAAHGAPSALSRSAVEDFIANRTNEIPNYKTGTASASVGGQPLRYEEPGAATAAPLGESQAPPPPPSQGVPIEVALAEEASSAPRVAQKGTTPPGRPIAEAEAAQEIRNETAKTAQPQTIESQFQQTKAPTDISILGKMATGGPIAQPADTGTVRPDQAAPQTTQLQPSGIGLPMAATPPVAGPREGVGTQGAVASPATGPGPIEPPRATVPSIPASIDPLDSAKRLVAAAQNAGTSTRKALVDGLGISPSQANKLLRQLDTGQVPEPVTAPTEPATQPPVPQSVEQRTSVDRRTQDQPVTEDRRTAARRASVEQAVQSEGLATDHPAYPGIVAQRVSDQNALHTDQMTGIGNKLHWDEMQAEVSRRHDEQPGRDHVISIDLDSFKQYNDKISHKAGDAVLKHTASILRDEMDGDSARFGGDEMGAVAYDSTPEQAQAHALAIKQRLENTPLDVVDDHGNVVHLDGVRAHVGVGENEDVANAAVNRVAAPSRVGGRGDVPIQTRAELPLPHQGESVSEPARVSGEGIPNPNPERQGGLERLSGQGIRQDGNPGGSNIERVGGNAPSAGVGLLDAPGQPIERVRGSSDYPLNDTGRAEADMVGKRLASHGGLDKIYAGQDLDRVRETAARISQETGAPVVDSGDAFNAWHRGKLEGQPTADVADESARYVKDHPDTAIPGRGPLSTRDGESFNDFKARALGGLQNVLKEYEADPSRRIGIVTHNGVRALANASDLDALGKGADPSTVAVDKDAFLKSGEHHEPGQQERIFKDADGKFKIQAETPGQGEPQGGVMLMRHEVTDANSPKENEQAKANLAEPNIGDRVVTQVGGKEAHGILVQTGGDEPATGAKLLSKAKVRLDDGRTAFVKTSTVQPETPAEAVARAGKEAYGREIPQATPEDVAAQMKRAETAQPTSRPPFNLSRMNLTDGNKDLLARMYAASPDQYEAAKNGTMTFDDFNKMGLKIGGLTTPEEFAQAIKAGVPLNDPGMVTYARQVSELHARNLQAAKDSLDALKAQVGENPSHVDTARLQEAQHAYLSAALEKTNFDLAMKGAQAQAARTMVAFKILAADRGPLEQMIARMFNESC